MSTMDGTIQFIGRSVEDLLSNTLSDGPMANDSPFRSEDGTRHVLVDRIGINRVLP